MNQHNLKDFDEEKFNCGIHDECQLSILYFGEPLKRKQRILCIDCFLDVLHLEHEQPAQIQQKHVDFHQFMVNPGSEIMKITNINESKDKINEMQQIELMEKMISNFQETVKKVLATIQQDIKQFKTQFESSNPLALKSLKMKLIKCMKASFDILEKIIFQGMPAIICKELDQFPEIHQLISQGKQIKILIIILRDCGWIKF